LPTQSILDRRHQRLRSLPQTLQRLIHFLAILSILLYLVTQIFDQFLTTLAVCDLRVAILLTSFCGGLVGATVLIGPGRRIVRVGE
jgi:hypothetical protein